MVDSGEEEKVETGSGGGGGILTFPRYFSSLIFFPTVLT